MFGATPVWERNRKRSRIGAKTIAPEPRSFAPAAAAPENPDHPVMAPAPHRAFAVSQTVTPHTVAPSTLVAHDTASPEEPITRTRVHQVSRANAASPITITAVMVGAVSLLGAVVWFTTRANDGVPDLSSPAMSSDVATAPVVSPPAVDRSAAAPSPVTARVPVTSSRRDVTGPRVRVATNAAATGTNASTILPAGPQPYSTLNPGVAPQPVIPAAPPATVEAAPEPVTVEPPITPDPAPDITPLT